MFESLPKMSWKSSENLKANLESLRFAPLKMLPPLEEVPARETSDAARLCPNPLVSVVMTTFNHADNIRQAIEGVLMQETDFPFELLIGEDASTDGTREICFELQRQYPERIRVIWSEANVNHLAGNGRRTCSRVRGEFMAFCEGDDRWIDSYKLQRQVDLMRAHPEVGVCLGGTEVEYVREGRVDGFPYAGRPDCVISGGDFLAAYLGAGKLSGFTYDTRHFQTSGYLFRMSAWRVAQEAYSDVYGWNLRFGDLVWLTTVASLSDVGFVMDGVSRYRLTGRNATATQGAALLLDGCLYDLYLRVRVRGESFDAAFGKCARRLRRIGGTVLASRRAEDQIEAARQIAGSPLLRRLFMRSGYQRILPLLEHGALTARAWKRCCRIGRLLNVFRAE